LSTLGYGRLRVRVIEVILDGRVLRCEHPDDIDQ
jgi:hypothetical protein